MSLVAYAERELALAGLLAEDSDYSGMLGHAALDIIKVFAEQGHSGLSAELTTEIVAKLMRFEPLTPLTYGPEEWMNQSEASGVPMWQNTRKFSVFSNDGGLTHYDLDDKEKS